MLAWHDTAWAQSPAELQAARETELPDLRLVDAQQVDSRMSSLGIRFGYLDPDGDHVTDDAMDTLATALQHALNI